MYEAIRQLRAIPIVSVAAVALIGCGSSGSKSLSNADFVRQANQICTDVNRKVAALPAVRTFSDIEADGPKELSYVNGALAKLQALKAPSAKQAAFSQYLASVKQEAALVSQLDAAAKHRNLAQIKAIASSGQASGQQVHAQATQLGLSECARNVNEGSAR